MEDLFDTRWFKKTKFFVSAVGQWPFQTRRMRNFIRISYHVLVWSAVPSMLKAFYLYCWIKGKLEAVVLCFPALFTIFGATIKYNHYTVNNLETKLLLERLRKDWILISDMDQKSYNVLQDYAEMGRATVQFYATYIYLSVSIFLAAPNIPRILDVIHPLNESRPTRQLYPMDYGEVGNNYQGIIFIHASLGTLLVINIFVACESIYMPLVFHCCGLFSVVRLERASTSEVLENIRRTESVLVSNDENMVCLRQHCVDGAVLASCVKLHNRAIWYADYLNGYYSINFLILVTMNMILVSVTGLQIGDLEELVAAGIYSLAQLLHLFFLSLPGQLLMDSSESVRVSAYSFPWYNLQPNVQKLLILIIMRSSKPSLITAGSFFTLQMETFSSVVQTSMSYLTVLSSFY